MKKTIRLILMFASLLMSFNSYRLYVSKDTHKHILNKEHRSYVTYDNAVEDNIRYIPKGKTMAVVSGLNRLDGTITYFDFETNSFYALAHYAQLAGGAIDKFAYFSYPISFEPDSGDGVGQLFFNPMTLGQFTDPFGVIEKNDSSGIKGRLLIKKEDLPELVSVKIGSKVKFGFAQIRATVENGNERLIDIFIIFKEKNNNFLYKIIDTDFLDAYGGILYGMSGSPVFQDGLLIGAVSGASVDFKDVGFLTPITEIIK